MNQAKSDVGKPDETQEVTAAKQISYIDAVRSNRAGGHGLVLEYKLQGFVVEISPEEWDEGGKLWQFSVLTTVVGHKPSYGEIQKWVKLNYKSNKPNILQLRP